MKKITFMLLALCATATVNAQTGPMMASALGESTSVDELVGWTYWYNKTTTTDPTDDTSATRQTLANAGSTADRAYVCFTKVDDTHIKIYGMFEMPVEASVTFNSGKVSTIIIPCDQVIAYDKDKGEIKLSQKTWVSTLNDGAGGWHNFSDVRIYFGYNSNNSQYYWYVSNNWIQPYYMDGEEKVILKSYVPSGNYCYAYKAANVSGGVQYADWNALMFVEFDKNLSSTSKSRAYAVNVVQSGNAVSITNFYGAGKNVSVNLHADATLDIPQQVGATYNSVDYNTMAADYSGGTNQNAGETIYGSGDENELNWGNWKLVAGNSWTGALKSGKIIFLNKDVDKFHFPVALTISDAGIASFSSQKNVDFSQATKLGDTPETVALTPNVVTDFTAQKATLEALDAPIPANYGVFVKGEAGDYEVPTVAEAATPNIVNHLLATSNQEVQGDGSTIYALGLKDGKPGVMLVTAGTTIATNKAYLEGNFGSGAKFISFDGETTSIDGVELSADEAAPAYNLQGQRVGQNYRGIVVKNGKKSVVR